MLTLYRRHLRACAHRDEGRAWRRCRCPIWVQGTLEGKPIRESLTRVRDITSWERATELVHEWEVKGKVPDQAVEVTIAAATASFVTDLERRGLTQDVIRKYKLLFRLLEAFAKSKGMLLLRELELPTLREFCANWSKRAKDDGEKLRPTTANKRLDRLRAFLRFAFESKWIDHNPARQIQSVKTKQRQTLPFSTEEMQTTLEACNPTAKDSRRMRLYLARMRAFVLLLRYSGLRLGDGARLAKDQIVPYFRDTEKRYKLLLYTQKTGVPVYVPLPAFVAEALDSIPHANEKYFFLERLFGQGRLRQSMGQISAPAVPPRQDRQGPRA
jgi:site-specific recombinase XerD